MTDVAFYYGQKYIKYALCGYIQHRTTDFILPRQLAAVGEKRTGYRYRRINSLKGLDYFMEQFEFFEKPFNLYSSVATVNNNFPLLSMSPKEESEQMKDLSEEKGNNPFSNFVEGYDFKLDIDNTDLEIAKEDAVKVFDHFSKQRIPFWFMFSGNKGFNFTVPFPVIPKTFEIGNSMKLDLSKSEDIKKLPKINFNIATNIKKLLGITSIDLTVYTIGRVFKVPYSIDRHNDLVALPLDSRSDLVNFRKEDTTIKSVIRNFKLFNRGLLLKQGNANGIKELYNNFGVAKKGILGKLKDGIEGFKEGFR